MRAMGNLSRDEVNSPVSPSLSPSSPSSALALALALALTLALVAMRSITWTRTKPHRASTHAGPCPSPISGPGQLRKVFDQFDTSKDGSLDALELRCALRVALGVDVSASDVDRLIGQIDNDGNGVLNFDEFMGICQDKSA